MTPFIWLVLRWHGAWSCWFGLIQLSRRCVFTNQLYVQIRKSALLIPAGADRRRTGRTEPQLATKSACWAAMGTETTRFPSVRDHQSSGLTGRYRDAAAGHRAGEAAGIVNLRRDDQYPVERSARDVCSRRAVIQAPTHTNWSVNSAGVPNRYTGRDRSAIQSGASGAGKPRWPPAPAKPLADMMGFRFEVARRGQRRMGLFIPRMQQGADLSDDRRAWLPHDFAGCGRQYRTVKQRYEQIVEGMSAEIYYRAARAVCQHRRGRNGALDLRPGDTTHISATRGSGGFLQDRANADSVVESCAPTAIRTPLSRYLNETESVVPCSAN